MPLYNPPGVTGPTGPRGATGPAGNPANYGEIRIASGTTGTVISTVLSTTGAGYTGIVGWNVSGISNNTTLGIGSRGNNNIIVTQSGVYYVSAMLTTNITSSSLLDNYNIAIFVNGIIKDFIAGNNTGSSTSKIGVVISGLLSLNANDIVDIRIGTTNQVGGGTTITITDAYLTLMSVGANGAQGPTGVAGPQGATGPAGGGGGGGGSPATATQFGTISLGGDLGGTGSTASGPRIGSLQGNGTGVNQYVLMPTGVGFAFGLSAAGATGLIKIGGNSNGPLLPIIGGVDDSTGNSIAILSFNTNPFGFALGSANQSFAYANCYCNDFSFYNTQTGNPHFELDYGGSFSIISTLQRYRFNYNITGPSIVHDQAAAGGGLSGLSSDFSIITQAPHPTLGANAGNLNLTIPAPGLINPNSFAGINHFIGASGVTTGPVFAVTRDSFGNPTVKIRSVNGTGTLGFQVGSSVASSTMIFPGTVGASGTFLKSIDSIGNLVWGNAPTGPIGQQGPTGTIGQQGPTGTIGATGIQGQTGTAGWAAQPFNSITFTGINQPTSSVFTAVPSSVMNLTMHQTANSSWDFAGSIFPVTIATSIAGPYNWVEYGIVVDGIAGPLNKASFITGTNNISVQYNTQLTAGSHTGYVQWRVPTGVNANRLQMGQLRAVGLEGVIGPAGGIGVTSVSTVNITSGTQVLTAAQTTTPVLYLAGKLTGNVTLQAPLINGTMYRVWGGHNPNGFYVTFGSSSGNVCWVAPNQFTDFLCDGVNWNYLSFGNPVQVSINVNAAMAVGATSTPLYSIPLLAPYGAIRVIAAEAFVKAVPTGGGTVIGVGVSSGSSQLLATLIPSGISNVYGSFTSELGTDMNANRGYQARYTTASGITIYYNQTQGTAAAATGAIDVNLITYFEGAI